MGTLRLIGKDPDSPNNGSPTVWLDEDDGSFVIQGWRLDLDTEVQVGQVPGHETVVRLPARMATILREVASGGAASTA
jgi:hypothetical protein